TDLAGYCFTGTAERDGKRVISVVMKTDSEAARFQETAKLFDYGFKNFESKELFKAGYQVEKESTIPVSKGKEKTVSIELDKGFTAPIFKGEEDLYKVVYQIDKKKLDKDGALTAPIKKGEKIGKAELVYEGKNEYGFIDKE